MSRRRSPEKRELPADPRFGDVMVTKFINYCMKDGKRSVSERTFYRALDIVKDKSGQEGIEVFRAALNNVKPSVEVKSRRSDRYGRANSAVTPAKQARLSKAGLLWLKSHHQMRDRARFDVVAIDHTDVEPRVELIQNAFELKYG